MIFEQGLRFLINKTSTLVTVDVVNVHTFVQTCDWKNESIHMVLKFSLKVNALAERHVPNSPAFSK